jgi:3-deoxy-manno-octulosonate cytidylyltransferase (CMP-KDO synthetase)
MSRNVVIIPARWGSTRFPGKPLYEIAGKPLLRHVWERCRSAERIESTIIATDDMRIAEAAFSWGAEVALTSPKHQSGTDRIAEVAKYAKDFSLIVNVQGDEPLVDPQLLNLIVSTLQQNRQMTIVTAAHPFENSRDALSPHQVKVVIDLSGNALYFSRAPIPHSRNGGFLAADYPKRRFGNRRSLFLRHQGIYGFRREMLLQFVKWKPTPLEQAESLEQLRALENGVRVHVLVTKHGSPGVDTPADAEAVAASLRKWSTSPARRRRQKSRAHR